ncbi:MAG: ATP-binding cassette domain-containing protein [Pseudomonadales bacterium]|nr:ATP-binding cassette domain-containing protein [Pseudomonadales bacterium]MCP5330694.1 ATP-binding cassette domain-containing protein [Pseudomonadales bacterium]
MSQEIVYIENALSRVNAEAVLKIPQFSIRSGQHWCLFGGNGAGKSLCARLLLKALPSGAAHVHYAEGMDPARDVLTVSFEEQQRLWTLDNRHDISEYSSDARDPGTTVASLVLGGSAADERFHDILRSLGLLELQGRGIRFLSSGQCRKAMLAQALYQRPRLLILDEPLESIDREAQGHITEALARWMSPQTSTLLLCRRERDILPGITHLALMDALAMIAQGSIESMRHDARFVEICQRRTALPDTLPAPVPGRRRFAPLPEGAALISLRGVSASYGERRVLHELSWSMKPGQHTLIEGPNGCGKSTLLSLINGENHMAYGQDITLFGRRRGSGETVWDIKARFGVVSNEIHNRYVKGWRVLDVVVSGFFDSVGLYDDAGAGEQQAARQWLQALGIADLARRFYHTISFGQQRLVLLARAMVKYPSVLILDEPCVGLDEQTRTLILAITDRIAATTPTQILFVSHTRGEAPACINQWLSFTAQGVVIREG